MVWDLHFLWDHLLSLEVVQPRGNQERDTHLHTAPHQQFERHRRQRDRLSHCIPSLKHPFWRVFLCTLPSCSQKGLLKLFLKKSVPFGWGRDEFSYGFFFVPSWLYLAALSSNLFWSFSVLVWHCWLIWYVLIRTWSFLRNINALNV